MSNTKKFIFLSIVLSFLLPFCTAAVVSKIVSFQKDASHVLILCNIYYGLIQGKPAFELDMRQNEALKKFFVTLSTSNKPIALYSDYNCMCNQQVVLPGFEEILKTRVTFTRELDEHCASGKPFGAITVDSWDTRTKSNLAILEIFTKFNDKIIENLARNFRIPDDITGDPVYYFFEQFDAHYARVFFSGNAVTDSLNKLYQGYKQLSLGNSVKGLPAVERIRVQDFLSSTFSWVKKAHNLAEQRILSESDYAQFNQAVSATIVTIAPFLVPTATHPDANRDSVLNDIIIALLDQRKSLAAFYKEVSLLFQKIDYYTGITSLYQKLEADKCVITNSSNLTLLQVGDKFLEPLERYYIARGYQMIFNSDVTQVSFEHPQRFTELLAYLAQRYV